MVLPNFSKISPFSTTVMTADFGEGPSRTSALSAVTITRPLSTALGGTTSALADPVQN
jgi:hypothetical protein